VTDVQKKITMIPNRISNHPPFALLEAIGQYDKKGFFSQENIRKNFVIENTQIILFDTN